MAISVNAGEKEVKRANFGGKLEQWKAIHESARASRRSNVATSPRRDVSTSRRWVNQYNSQQAVTSRRGNVATSARDFPSIIKSSKGSELERKSGGVRMRARNSRAAATPTSKKCP